MHTIIGPGSQQYKEETNERLEYKINKAVKIAPLPKSFIEYLLITYAYSNKEINDAKAATALSLSLRLLLNGSFPGLAALNSNASNITLFI